MTLPSDRYALSSLTVCPHSVLFEKLEQIVNIDENSESLTVNLRTEKCYEAETSTGREFNDSKDNECNITDNTQKNICELEPAQSKIKYSEKLVNDVIWCDEDEFSLINQIPDQHDSSNCVIHEDRDVLDATEYYHENVLHVTIAPSTYCSNEKQLVCDGSSSGEHHYVDQGTSDVGLPLNGSEQVHPHCVVSEPKTTYSSQLQTSTGAVFQDQVKEDINIVAADAIDVMHLLHENNSESDNFAVATNTVEEVATMTQSTESVSIEAVFVESFTADKLDILEDEELSVNKDTQQEHVVPYDLTSVELDTDLSFTGTAAHDDTPESVHPTVVSKEQFIEVTIAGDVSAIDIAPVVMTHVGSTSDHELDDDEKSIHDQVYNAETDQKSDSETVHISMSDNTNLEMYQSDEVATALSIAIVDKAIPVELQDKCLAGNEYDHTDETTSVSIVQCVDDMAQQADVKLEQPHVNNDVTTEHPGVTLANIEDHSVTSYATIKEHETVGQVSNPTIPIGLDECGIQQHEVVTRHLDVNSSSNSHKTTIENCAAEHSLILQEQIDDVSGNMPMTDTSVVKTTNSLAAELLPSRIDISSSFTKINDSHKSQIYLGDRDVKDLVNKAVVTDLDVDMSLGENDCMVNTTDIQPDDIQIEIQYEDTHVLTTKAEDEHTSEQSAEQTTNIEDANMDNLPASYTCMAENVAIEKQHVSLDTSAVADDLPIMDEVTDETAPFIVVRDLVYETSQDDTLEQVHYSSTDVEEHRPITYAPNASAHIEVEHNELQQSDLVTTEEMVAADETGAHQLTKYDEENIAIVDAHHETATDGIPAVNENPSAVSHRGEPCDEIHSNSVANILYDDTTMSTTEITSRDTVLGAEHSDSCSPCIIYALETASGLVDVTHEDVDLLSDVGVVEPSESGTVGDETTHVHAKDECDIGHETTPKVYCVDESSTQIDDRDFGDVTAQLNKVVQSDVTSDQHLVNETSNVMADNEYIVTTDNEKQIEQLPVASAVPDADDVPSVEYIADVTAPIIDNLTVCEYAGEKGITQIANVMTEDQFDTTVATLEPDLTYEAQIEECIDINFTTLLSAVDDIQGGRSPISMSSIKQPVREISTNTDSMTDKTSNIEDIADVAVTTDGVSNDVEIPSESTKVNASDRSQISIYDKSLNPPVNVAVAIDLDASTLVDTKLQTNDGVQIEIQCEDTHVLTTKAEDECTSEQSAEQTTDIEDANMDNLPASYTCMAENVAIEEQHVGLDTSALADDLPIMDEVTDETAPFIVVRDLVYETSQDDTLEQVHYSSTDVEEHRPITYAPNASAHIEVEYNELQQSDLVTTVEMVDADETGAQLTKYDEENIAIVDAHHETATDGIPVVNENPSAVRDRGEPCDDIHSNSVTNILYDDTTMSTTEIASRDTVLGAEHSDSCSPCIIYALETASELVDVTHEDVDLLSDVGVVEPSESGTVGDETTHVHAKDECDIGHETTPKVYCVDESSTQIDDRDFGDVTAQLNKVVQSDVTSDQHLVNDTSNVMADNEYIVTTDNEKQIEQLHVATAVTDVDDVASVEYIADVTAPIIDNLTVCEYAGEKGITQIANVMTEDQFDTTVATLEPDLTYEAHIEECIAINFTTLLSAVDDIQGGRSPIGMSSIKQPVREISTNTDSMTDKTSNIEDIADVAVTTDGVSNDVKIPSESTKVNASDRSQISIYDKNLNPPVNVAVAIDLDASTLVDTKLQTNDGVQIEIQCEDTHVLTTKAEDECTSEQSAEQTTDIEDANMDNLPASYTCMAENVAVEEQHVSLDTSAVADDLPIMDEVTDETAPFIVVRDLVYETSQDDTLEQVHYSSTDVEEHRPITYAPNGSAHIEVEHNELQQSDLVTTEEMVAADETGAHQLTKYDEENIAIVDAHHETATDGIPAVNENPSAVSHRGEPCDEIHSNSVANILYDDTTMSTTEIASRDTVLGAEHSDSCSPCIIYALETASELVDVTHEDVDLLSDVGVVEPSESGTVGDETTHVHAKDECDIGHETTPKVYCVDESSTQIDDRDFGDVTAQLNKVVQSDVTSDQHLVNETSNVMADNEYIVTTDNEKQIEQLPVASAVPDADDVPSVEYIADVTAPIIDNLTVCEYAGEKGITQIANVMTEDQFDTTVATLEPDLTYETHIEECIDINFTALVSAVDDIQGGRSSVSMSSIIKQPDQEIADKCTDNIVTAHNAVSTDMEQDCNAIVATTITHVDLSTTIGHSDDDIPNRIVPLHVNRNVLSGAMADLEISHPPICSTLNLHETAIDTVVLVTDENNETVEISHVYKMPDIADIIPTDPIPNLSTTFLLTDENNDTVKLSSVENSNHEANFKKPFNIVCSQASGENPMSLEANITVKIKDEQITKNRVDEAFVDNSETDASKYDTSVKFEMTEEVAMKDDLNQTFSDSLEKVSDSTITSNVIESQFPELPCKTHTEQNVMQTVEPLNTIKGIHTHNHNRLIDLLYFHSDQCSTASIP